MAIQLYGFYPRGFGSLSYFVAAESLEDARKKVTEYVETNQPFRWEEWPHTYKIEVVSVGSVLVNDNS